MPMMGWWLEDSVDLGSEMMTIDYCRLIVDADKGRLITDADRRRLVADVDGGKCRSCCRWDRTR